MGTDVIRLRWRLSPPRRIWELDAAQPPVVPPMSLRSKPHMCPSRTIPRLSPSNGPGCKLLWISGRKRAPTSCCLHTNTSAHWVDNKWVGGWVCWELRMPKNQTPRGSGEKQSPVGGRVHGCSSELSFATVSDVNPWSRRGEKRTPMVRLQPQIFSQQRSLQRSVETPLPSRSREMIYTVVWKITTATKITGQKGQ